LFQQFRKPAQECGQRRSCLCSPLAALAQISALRPAARRPGRAQPVEPY